MKKYYSFSWHNRKDREDWFPILPCSVWIGLNGTGAVVNINTAGKLSYEWNYARVKADKDFTAISRAVIRGLISDTPNEKKRCLNLNNGSVANAWYELGYRLQKLGDGWALFSRMD